MIFDIGASQALAWFIGVLHLGGMLIVGLIPISILIRLSLFALLVASLMHILLTHALRSSPHAIRKVTFEHDGEWALERRNEELLGPCRLCSHFVHRWLVILQLRCTRGRLPISLVVTADAVDGDAFRRLRARLSSLGSTE